MQDVFVLACFFFIVHLFIYLCSDIIEKEFTILPSKEYYKIIKILVMLKTA